MKREKFSRGQVAVLLTLGIGTLLGAIALGADVGVMYYFHMQLQKGADAAALAGANYLDESETGLSLASTSVSGSCTGWADDPKKAACTYAANNYLATDSDSLQITETAASAAADTPNIKVIVKRKNLPYMFGRVIGLSTYDIAASATAYQGATGATTHLFPMGIQCNSPCNLSALDPGSPVAFGTKFTTADPNAPGNWQWLGSGSGAKGLGDAVANGMPGIYSIGEQIGTKPGADGNSGPVKTAFANLMSTCPALSPDPCSGAGNPSNIPSTDPCLVTVPAVDFAGMSGTSSTTAIEAFAEVYIEPTSTSSTSKSGGGITGCFVKQLDPNAVASGGPALGSLGRSVLVQ